MKRRPMDRKVFLETLGVGSIAAASLPAILDTLATPAEAAGGAAGAQNGYFFVSLSTDKRAGVNHAVIMSGSGSVTSSVVSGGGSFTSFDPTTPVPRAILHAGTWVPTALNTFKVLGTYGTLAGGILEMKVELHQVLPSLATIPATLRVVCDLGPAGIDTGEPEGYQLTIADGSFGPFTPLQPTVLGVSVLTTQVAGIPLAATPYYGSRHHGMGGPVP